MSYNSVRSYGENYKNVVPKLYGILILILNDKVILPPGNIGRFRYDSLQFSVVLKGHWFAATGPN
jgi:hypothetical protein